MTEVLKAMATSAAILLPIVVLIVMISIAVVKRGEIQMRGGDHAILQESHGVAVQPAGSAVAAAAAAAPAAKKTPAVQATEEISVIIILVLGIVMFSLVMGILLLISVLQHLS